MSPTGQTLDGKKRQVDLNWMVSHWATPCSRDYRYPNLISFSERGGGKKGEQLVNQVALWATPNCCDATRASPETNEQKKTRGAHTGQSLIDQAAYWSTPAAQQHNYDESPETFRARQERLKAKGINGNGAGTPLGIQAAETALSGPTPNGLTVQTVNPGGLNPEFVSWLMGFAKGYLSCAPSAMPSSRKSRQK
jgi:hypothetical protein